MELHRSSIFVHFPKTGGRSVHRTADQAGRKLISSGHHPASSLGLDLPSWVVLRDPFEWFISVYRFCVDAGWSVLPDLKDMTFDQFVTQGKPCYCDEYCRELEVEKVTHLYRYDDLQKAYNTHVGPETLIQFGVSVSPRPDLTPELKRIIKANNPLGFSIYERVKKL